MGNHIVALIAGAILYTIGTAAVFSLVIIGIQIGRWWGAS
ncbi:hypothetical protein ACVL5V_005516 [Bradyrhizobium ottawaense]